MRTGFWAQGSSTVSWLGSQGLTDVTWRRTQAEIDREKHNAMVKKGASDESAEALLPERKKYDHACVAITFCVLYRLTEKAVTQVLDEYPAAARRVRL